MIFLPHTNAVILLEPYCGTITEPGLPVITVLKINVYTNEIHQASETSDPFRLLILKNLKADNKTQYLLQNPYTHGVQ